MSDVYQERYAAHQTRKAKVLRGLIEERHSDRVFAEREVSDDELRLVLDAARSAASSCARHGVQVQTVRSRDDKALLGGLLVGGVGWIHRAPVVLLLMGDRQAYKAPGEIAYMPFIDAGVMAGQMYLAATASGFSCCFVNPNVREHNKPHLSRVFGSGVFCGALAIGWPRGSDPEWVGDTS